MDQLLIAFSLDFSDEKKLVEVLDRLLAEQRPSSVCVVNDREKFAAKYFSALSIDITEKRCKTRLEARQLVKNSSHVIAFWSGEDLNDIIFEARSQDRPLRLTTFLVTRVVNKDSNVDYDVYIGRSGPWGNPFPIIPGTEETREKVIERYKEYFEQEILSNSSKKKALAELRGLRLACHCKPLACHGDVIARYLNNYSEKED